MSNWIAKNLALLCLALSLGSVLLLPLLDRVLAVLAPGSGPVLTFGVSRDLGVMAGLCALLLGLGGTALVWLKRVKPAERRPGTWDCGYAAPTARITTPYIS